MHYESAKAYRIALHREVMSSMAIIPWDTAFKTQLYKSICSIPHSLPLEVAERIRQEAFEIVNKKLNTIH